MSEETNSNPSRLELITRSRWFILAVVLVATLIVSISWWFLDIELPAIGREFKLFGLAFGVGSLAALVPSTKLVDWLHTENKRFLVCYNAETDDFSLWALSPAEWYDLEVREELHKLNASEPVYEVNSYDADENVAVGSWRGSASDLELVENREAVKEVRGDLEQLAREGLAVRAKQSSIVRGAVSDIVRDFVSDFEEESLYNGENIESRVKSALDGLDRGEPNSGDPDQEENPDPLVESFAEDTETPENATNGN